MRRRDAVILPRNVPSPLRSSPAVLTLLRPTFSPPARRRPASVHPRASVDDGLPERGRRSEEHTSELQSRENLVCRLLLEKKKARVAPYGIPESSRTNRGVRYASESGCSNPMITSGTLTDASLQRVERAAVFVAPPHPTKQ